jgi:hypothetical protein
LRPTLCADVDSTIWDTGAWVCSAVLDITGETLDIDRITTWTHVLDTYGEKLSIAIFDRVFDPERVRDREPYPGASEVLRALQERHGIEIHFVTHNDPEIMASHLDPGSEPISALVWDLRLRSRTSSASWKNWMPSAS